MKLANFIKYCLGYVKLSKQRSFFSQQKESVKLEDDQISIEGLLNGEIDGELAELINLETFYSNDPKNVKEEDKEDYEEEKRLANKIEEIYNKYRNDQFTKEITLNFGYFEIELELETEIDDEYEGTVKETTVKVDEYPIFSLPVKIETQSEKGVRKYYLFYADQEIKINLSVLEKLFEKNEKADLFYQLVEEIGKDEVEGKFTLPIVDTKALYDTWGKISSYLKLTEAKFEEDSFDLETSTLSLNSRSNYFLAEDLLKLSKMEEDELVGTALESWVNDSETNIHSEIPSEEQLYFPFPYDKYQLNSLSLINNQASIIQGPPGTGKSETIANILCHLAAKDQKVLFVSQKSQALKVVKDKLKKTGVNYMFGYIPNPASSQITEEDEEDGVAPQLTALSTFIQKMEYKIISGQVRNESLETISQRLGGLRKSFNSVVEAERKYFELDQELKKLSEYMVNVGNTGNFLTNANKEEWSKLNALSKEIGDLGDVIVSYDSTSSGKFASIPPDLLGNKEYSPTVKLILENVSKSGFDGNSRLFRSISNAKRKLALRDAWTVLPREIRNKIDEIISKDSSRHECVRELRELYDYIQHNENINKKQKLEAEFRADIDRIGLNTGQYQEILDILKDKSISFEDLHFKIGRIEEIKIQLRELKTNYDLLDLRTQIGSARNDRSLVISSYIQNIINKRIREKWFQQSIKRVILRLAKAYGKSKKAYKTFDELRKDPENFNSIIDLVPVWIMELDDASRIIPLQPGMFDYVILDEASQCNVAYTIPVMFRAKKIILVGDTEQMRDSTIRFKSNKDFDELARKYEIPSDMQIKSTGNSVQSVLDIALLRGFNSNNLQYHYRSPSELIGFSNNYFYKPKGKELVALNNNYLTYKDTNKVILVHKVDVKDSLETEISDNINTLEAKEILKLFKSLRQDPITRDKSVGILTFFNGQATYIRELFEEEGFKEEDDNYIVSVIEGIQGDEKDIVIYSFVIRSPDQKRKYGALTGEGGDIQGDINKGRVNVAFTRAKLQVHCFVSTDLPEGIWIKKYVDYARENGEVDFYSQELREFDSYFEEEFYSQIKSKLSKEFLIQNQVKSCGFKIDFVITNSRNGKKIAIECDGPTHFENELDESLSIYVQSDEERQVVLEAAGWEFYRIKYSDWITKENKEEYIEQIKQLLYDNDSEVKSVKEKVSAKYEVKKIDFDLNPYMNKGNVWLALSAWGKQTGNFNGFQNKFCYSLGRYLARKSELTYKQANFGRYLLNMAVKKGFTPSEAE